MNQSARDILSSPWLAGAVFCLPAAVIVLSANLNIGNRWQAAVWATCLGVMAAGCLVNALRCGRILLHLSSSIRWSRAVALQSRRTSLRAPSGS